MKPKNSDRQRMRYFAQIEAYVNRQMTVAQREAFEHEVAENTDLARELDAYHAGSYLFDFAAKNLSENQILGLENHDALSETGRKFGFPTSIFVVLIFATIMLMLFAFLKGDQPVTTPIQPLEDKEQTKKNMPIAQVPTPDVLSRDEQLLAARLEMSSPAAGRVSPAPPPKKKPLTNPKTSPAIAQADVETGAREAREEERPSKKLVSNALINTGEEIVYHATQQITLAPGFHAKAGSSFKAFVKSN